MMNSEWLTTRPIAHRGLWSDDAPENSLAAFENAIAYNHPIELDVQMLHDGTMVVFHDRTLERMTGVTGDLMQKTFDEVSPLTLNGTEQKLPCLKDVLDLVQGKVPLLVELKSYGQDRTRFVQELRDVLNRYNGSFALSSFDPFLLRKIKKTFPQILCGQNFSHYSERGVLVGWVKKKCARISLVACKKKPDFVACHASLLPQSCIVRAAQSKGIPLLTWGIEDIKQWHVVRADVDNYIFDRELCEK